MEGAQEKKVEYSTYNLLILNKNLYWKCMKIKYEGCRNLLNIGKLLNIIYLAAILGSSNDSIHSKCNVDNFKYEILINDSRLHDICATFL